MNKLAATFKKWDKVTPPDNKSAIFEVVALSRSSQPHIISASWCETQRSFVLNHPVTMPITNVIAYKVISEAVDIELLYELRDLDE